jgi:hypothetical protein
VPVAVAPWVVSDALWERIEPLLPRVERRFRFPGRKRLPDRQALRGILFVLQTGIAWRHLPLELGFGSGSTCFGGSTSGSRLASGRRCTRSCSASCAPPVSSNGRARSLIQAMCRRKKGRLDGPEPG